jgi:prepilin-type N-terminal cleavage/methylation domain-containing protein
MKRKFSPQAGKKGFTLAEILCAMAVLSILVLLIAQLMGGAAKTMNFSENKMDVEGQVRTTFASMSNDFTNMIKKANVDIYFSKIPTAALPSPLNPALPDNNDAIYFYAQSEAVPAVGQVPTDASPFSIVGYQVIPYVSNYGGINKTLYHLVRYSRLLTLDSTGGAPGPIFCTYQSASSKSGYNSFHVPDTNFPPDDSSTLAGGPWASDIPYTSGTSTTDLPLYHTIADGIFRMEYTFLHTDGSYSDTPQLPPPAGAPKGYSVGTPPSDLSNVVAIVMTFAELDPASQRLVSDMATLVNDFPDSSLPEPTSSTTQAANQTPTLMATTWQNEVQTLSQAGSDIPPAITSKIRIYQRYFYLNND